MRVILFLKVEIMILTGDGKTGGVEFEIPKEIKNLN